MRAASYPFRLRVSDVSVTIPRKDHATTLTCRQSRDKTTPFFIYLWRCLVSGLPTRQTPEAKGVKSGAHGSTNRLPSTNLKKRGKTYTQWPPLLPSNLHILTCVDRLLPEAQPCMQLPQSTHPFAFLGTGFGTSPEATAPFHRLDWCWFTLKEALGVGQPWARCECSVLTLAWTGGGAASGARGRVFQIRAHRNSQKKNGTVATRSRHGALNALVFRPP